MYKIKILPAAKIDISDAAQWYNKRQKGLGIRFTKEVREKIKFIKSNPLLVPIRYDQTRTAVLKVFPFMMHYSINEANKLIILIGVYHTSRNPKIWKER